jgi:hypothetical protein
MRLVVMMVMMAGLAAGAGSPAGTAAPVTSVTLYSGGSAYFEHQGTVRGEAKIELSFKSGQVSGVLKSMMVQDGDGSQPATIVQPIDIPATQPAEGRRVEVGKNSTLAELVEQFRGSRVRLACAGEVVEATILSLEKKEKMTEKGTSEVVQLNLLSGGGLRSVPLESVLRIELNDPRMQEELNKAVEATWRDSEQERKTVTVQLRGAGERAVRVGYAMETQPWKISYRLLLAEKPLLQVWGSVVNETEEDWNHVRLNLMSGRPFAQTQELLMDADAANRATSGAGAPVGQPLRRAKPTPSREALDGGGESLRKAGDGRPESSGPLINSREAFRYSVEDVTVPKQSRAVVPVMSEAVTVERVAVYNESTLKKNPLQGVRIGNTTKHFLLEGPVAVLEEGSFVGDASMDNLAPGRQGMLTWGIDLALLVDASEVTHSAAISGGKIAAGVLAVEQRHVYSRQYVMENDDQQDRAMIIEHPIRRGYVLAEPKEAMESTDKVYRFRATAPAGKRVRLVVKEQAMEAEVIELVTADVQTLRSYARSTELPEAVRNAIGKAAGLRGQVDECQRLVQQKQGEITRLTRDQARIRENLKAAGDDGKLKEKLLGSLKAREEQIEELHKSVEQGQKDGEKARKEFEAYVGGLSVG